MADFESGKIFVGGIPWETNVTALTEYFSRYGEVSFSTIARDRNSGNPRGFAFVTFTDPSSALKALNDHHEIDGRTVEVKKAKPRQVQQYHQSNRESSIKTKKIFVGGLSANVTEEEFKNYFNKFGRITDVVVMYDNMTNRPRGFGFITFDSEDVVEKITSNSFHVLDGKYVEVKKAIPKEVSRNTSNGGQNSSYGGGMAAPYSVYPQENYWPDNGNPKFYPGHGGISPNGYGGVYGTGYHMPWPGYSSYGYGMGMPLVAASNHWNGLGTVGYGPVSHDPSFVYAMNTGSGFDNSEEFGKLDLSGGSNYDVQD
ncbi:hypothetical protein V2J09_007094 [Rumex salicifolius]